MRLQIQQLKAKGIRELTVLPLNKGSGHFDMIYMIWRYIISKITELVGKSNSSKAEEFGSS